MNPVRTIDAATEPVSLAEAKAHLRIDHADEDSYITDLITAARIYVEDYLKLALIDQTWSWTLNCWPREDRLINYCDEHPVISHTGSSVHYLETPRGPLIAVSSIKTFDDADNETIWASSNYYLALGQNRIYRRSGTNWPTASRVADGIEIIFRAGFSSSATDVPSTIRQGILELVAHLYENREPTSEGGVVTPVPLSLTDLFDGYRQRRLK